MEEIHFSLFLTLHYVDKYTNSNKIWIQKVKFKDYADPKTQKLKLAYVIFKIRCLNVYKNALNLLIVTKFVCH